MLNFYEFFAGGGMARAGLGPSWTCLFANDIDAKKVATYKRNWGDNSICGKDVSLLSSHDLPGIADLAWASFPCQDLSLAGMGAGLKGSRSGAFWPFWHLVKELSGEGRRPSTIVIENVCGALTSHGGVDFQSIVSAITAEGYRCGALVVDAALFLPHSRPRLFFIGVRDDIEVAESLIASGPVEPFHSAGLTTAFASLTSPAQNAWIWWNLPIPARRKQRFADLVEHSLSESSWHTRDETDLLLSLMSPVNLRKLEKAKSMNRLMVGSLYRRTRLDRAGKRTQRAEIRFDDVAGCLRTPGGGSSRQTIIVVQGAQVKSRLLSARETARLMGLSDDYILPENYNEAYHLTGDGVAVPVVRHLAQNIIEPLVRNNRIAVKPAA